MKKVVGMVFRQRPTRSYGTALRFSRSRARTGSTSQAMLRREDPHVVFATAFSISSYLVQARFARGYVMAVRFRGPGRGTVPVRGLDHAATSLVSSPRRLCAPRPSRSVSFTAELRHGRAFSR
jgi:hypothetical protein